MVPRDATITTGSAMNWFYTILYVYVLRRFKKCEYCGIRGFNVKWYSTADSLFGSLAGKYLHYECWLKAMDDGSFTYYGEYGLF